MYAFTIVDWIALAGWLCAWLGYGYCAERVGDRRPNLMASVAAFRRVWMREAYHRDPRITDVGLIGNLMQSATFFSSTTLLVLGATLAVLGTVERGAEVGIDRGGRLAVGLRGGDGRRRFLGGQRGHA